MHAKQKSAVYRRSFAAQNKPRGGAGRSCLQARSRVVKYACAGHGAHRRPDPALREGTLEEEINMSLIVKNLRKSFGGKTAVDDLSFEMTRPGVFGLIGTNGAGKTTTIRCILGIMTPDGGSAAWNGAPISRETLRFGYMPEERGIYMKSRVLEQLVYFGMLRGMTKQQARDSALAYMKRLKVLEYQNEIAEKLSKGNQQKIQLIATLIHNPELIFLDEPFSGLDPINAETLRQLINELVAEGRYIVMSSHQMSTVEEYCEDIVILHRGRTKLRGNLREIKAGYGHTRLVIACGQDVRPLAEELGLVLLEERADGLQYRIAGDSMAGALLARMLERGWYPTKYEVMEPSLHEIFIEKVGEDA